MLRFNFPVPRRRQKQAPASVISPPLNKVQKFLGAAEINVDAHTGRGTDAARNWDTRSGSCISISLSESSAGQDENVLDGALSSLAEARVVHSVGHRQPPCDEESGVLPRNQNDFRFGEAGIATNTSDEQSITDASSLRRQQSSSTITSYYDKSKVPLVISQQTSSSAMAKGLPQKASSLLDIDGTLANGDKKKTKPPKLDLTLLFPRRKPSNSTLAVSPSERGLVLGPDMMTRSPSPLAASPLEYVAQPTSGCRSEGKQQKRSIRSSVRRDVTNHPSANQGQPKQGGMSGQEASGLQSLYDHYEQMSFRDATPHEHISIPAVPEIAHQEWSSGRDVREEAARAHVGYNVQVPTKASSAPSNREETATSIVSIQQQDVDSTLGHYSLADCSESVSSRHTRTSKASGQRSQSLLDVDLLQTSVLSLSSDSEDEDFDEKPNTFVAPLGNWLPTKDGTHNSDYRQPVASCSSTSAMRHEIQTGSTSSAAYGHGHRMLPIPGNPPATANRRPRAANISPQTGATSVSINNTAKSSAIPLRSSSCTSRTSAASSNSSSSMVLPIYTVREARTITLAPTQVSSYAPSSTQDNNSSSGRMTPPLSPMSVEFYLHSSCSPEPDFDQGSVRSGHSLGADGSSRSGDTSYQHVMTVTRQEELLLAALRRKRSKMQEAITAEFEEKQECQSHRLPTLPQPPRHCSSNSALELQAARPQSSDRSSISFMDLPLLFEDDSIAGSQSAHTYDGERSSVNDSLEFDDGCSGSIESYDSYLFRTPDDQSPIGPPATGRHGNRFLHASVSGRVGTTLRRQALDDMQFQCQLHPLDDSIDIYMLDEHNDISLDRRNSSAEEEQSGIPRPDSPIEAQESFPRTKGVRISAVGRPDKGPGWW